MGLKISHKASFQNGKLKTDIQFSCDPEKVHRFSTDKRIGIFTAETCARYMDKYIPMDTGMLAQTYTTEPFLITYEQPYAHYQYYGENLNHPPLSTYGSGGTPPQQLHPLATHHWDKPMWKAHGNQIAKEISAYIERLG